MRVGEGRGGVLASSRVGRGGKVTSSEVKRVAIRLQCRVGLDCGSEQKDLGALTRRKEKVFSHFLEEGKLATKKKRSQAKRMGEWPGASHSRKRDKTRSNSALFHKKKGRPAGGEKRKTKG